LKTRAEDGADFADLVGVPRGDEQRRHARQFKKLVSNGQKKTAGCLCKKSARGLAQSKTLRAV
jgi:hypothetical protein